MNPKKAYKFCPKCAGRFVPPKGNLLECGHCHFHFYINPMPTNGVIIENERGEILLVKRAFPPKKGWWDVPGGFIQSQESLEASIKRELKEELGVDVTVGKLIGIYTDTYLFNGIINHTLCVMVRADIVSGTIIPADDAADFKFFPKKSVLKQRIAFEGVKRSLEDYIKSAISLPNLTA